jgi:hypothetical protein
MSDTKLNLKGSLHGVKNFKPYKTPDINNSIVDEHLCQANDFKIKYLQNKNLFYIYHSYNGLDDINTVIYTGRWYITDYAFDKNDLNENNKTFTILLKSIDWEDFETGQSSRKNVNIVINLTELGFNKLNRFFDKYTEK